MIVTKRQRQVMFPILEASKLGELLDIDQLYEALKMTQTKQALQCSIRFLEAKGLLEREYQTRRQKKRVILQPTSNAFLVLGK